MVITLTLTLQVSRDSQTNKPITAQIRNKWATFKEENYKELRSLIFYLGNCSKILSRKLTLEKLRYQKRLTDAEEEYKENFTYSDNNTELRDIIYFYKIVPINTFSFLVFS